MSDMAGKTRPSLLKKTLENVETSDLSNTDKKCIKQVFEAFSEVVRCKDCKHRETDACPMYHEEYVDWDDDGYLETDIIIHDATEDNSFCSHGERNDGAK